METTRLFFAISAFLTTLGGCCGGDPGQMPPADSGHMQGDDAALTEDAGPVLGDGGTVDASVADAGAPDVCWPAEPGREISGADACDAVGNAWTTHASDCGPLDCPYPADARVDVDANSACIIAFLERVDAGDGCGALADAMARCGECFDSATCRPTPAPGREISREDACAAIENAVVTRTDECGPLACPYPDDVVTIDSDANVACVIAVLEAVDSSAACGVLDETISRCGECL